MRWTLRICDSIGGLVDTKYVDIEPKVYAITESHVICANDTIFHAWQYQGCKISLSCSYHSLAAGEGPNRLMTPEQRDTTDLMRFIDDVEDLKPNSQLKRQLRAIFSIIYFS